jgi:pimeloyl-ACP methyl ester carboxylesterase
MRLHVREWGEGSDTVLLLHGLSSSGATWSAVASRLACLGYRVLAPDLRGHGESPRGGYSVAEWADDVVESIPAPPTVAIGHSLGGTVLARAASRLEPGRAVYVDPGWVVPGGRHAAIREALAVEKDLDAQALALRNPGWPSAELESTLEQVARWDIATLDGLLDGKDFDYTPPAPQVRSLIILPSTEPLVSEHDQYRLRRAGFEIRKVAGVGHSVFRDDLDAFVAALEGWI